ncbi:hypothetical protein [Longirhabdus pacifica]|uniref:hypothetical protein n=1 Tax=Longirhabdus pacifica TaxID=2305227 RepID=UPI00100898DA|nr:hypothetical protein [Longirhabdus pacifica]
MSIPKCSGHVCTHNTLQLDIDVPMNEEVCIYESIFDVNRSGMLSIRLFNPDSEPGDESETTFIPNRISESTVESASQPASQSEEVSLKNKDNVSSSDVTIRFIKADGTSTQSIPLQRGSATFTFSNVSKILVKNNTNEMIDTLCEICLELQPGLICQHTEPELEENFLQPGDKVTLYRSFPEQLSRGMISFENLSDGPELRITFVTNKGNKTRKILFGSGGIYSFEHTKEIMLENIGSSDLTNGEYQLCIVFSYDQD